MRCLEQLAVVAKLEAQREFVLWWDGLKHGGEAPKQGGRPKKTSRTADVLDLQSLGLDRDTLCRWRKKLKEPAAFERTKEEAFDRCRRLGEKHCKL